MENIELIAHALDAPCTSTRYVHSVRDGSGHTVIHRSRQRRLRECLKEDARMQRADFRTFYRDAHNVSCLTDREKMLLGLAVAMTRNCDP